FSKKTAIATLIFMSFSPLMIWISVWPSQPSNAIFFQIISIYLATLAYKKKKKKLISWAVVTSLISVQLYPPMYLLIPTQLIIFYKFFWPKIKQKKKFIQKIILSAFIIYLPLIIFEIISQYANFNTIINFVKNSAQQPNNKNIYQNIQTNIKDLYGFIHWKIPTQKYFKYFFYPSISGLIYLLIKKNKNHPKHIIILSYILLPILLVSLIQEKINNVYIFSLAPIIFVLLGDIISTVSNKIYYPCITLITILYILVTYQELFKYKPINKLQQSKDICQTIINTNKKHNISDNNFSLFTIDPSNSWNWNGPFYWHLLEKTTNKKLINLNPYTSRSETINPQPSFLYLICEQNTGDSCVKTYSTQKQINKIKIISKWNFINSQVFLIKST
ncbi:hypothetical protein KKE45_04230, partial [Patescibacteria group bacterium]|nr:hypothetical protein [Patescibacteria group bacterium]